MPNYESKRVRQSWAILDTINRCQTLKPQKGTAISTTWWQITAITDINLGKLNSNMKNKILVADLMENCGGQTNIE